MSFFRRSALWLPIACLCVVCAGTALAQVNGSQDLRAIFESGNASYETADYPSAIDAYTRLIDGGVVDADLYYNLGNAYYRNGELGEAVLFYMRSLRLDPRNRDASDNLSLVRTQLHDKQFVKSENRLVKGIVWLHDTLNAREMTMFASISYGVFCLLAMVLIFARSPRVAAAYRRVSLVSPGRLIGLSLRQDVLAAMAVVCIFLVTSAASAYSKRVGNQNEAVVLAGESAVFSGPADDSTLQFKIHEGTVVDAREQRGAWVKVELPGGMSGWVSAEAVRKV